MLIIHVIDLLLAMYKMDSVDILINIDIDNTIRK